MKKINKTFKAIQIISLYMFPKKLGWQIRVRCIDDKAPYFTDIDLYSETQPMSIGTQVKKLK